MQRRHQTNNDAVLSMPRGGDVYIYVVAACVADQSMSRRIAGRKGRTVRPPRSLHHRRRQQQRQRPPSPRLSGRVPPPHAAPASSCASRGRSLPATLCSQP